MPEKRFIALEKSNCCVLIPSLSPDQRLPDYVRDLLESGFGGVVVVNDGSKKEYDPFFEACAAMDGCTVIGYEVNHGKGYALRYGIRHIYENTSFEGIITADSDGQHTPVDTAKMAAEMDGEHLWLGSRDFTSANTNIPKRSRVGNRITSFVFKLFYGQYLPDTQTGLRAFPRSLCPFMLEVTGDRFEYEMNVLIRCSEKKIKMLVVPIDTIYLEENKSSHFNPLKDSWRIYKLILGNFLMFIAASLSCWALDQGIYALVRYVIMPQQEKVRFLLWDITAGIIVGYIVARIISSLVNFAINKNAVFKIKESKGALLRYFLLAACCLAISTLVTGILSTYVGSGVDWLIKLVVDLIMFMINYRVQKVWVFRTDAK